MNGGLGSSRMGGKFVMGQRSSEQDVIERNSTSI